MCEMMIIQGGFLFLKKIKDEKKVLRTVLGSSTSIKLFDTQRESKINEILLANTGSESNKRL